MQPHKKKVLKVTAVALGIIAASFLIPAVIVPAYFGVSNASNCALSSNCASDSFGKCGAYQGSSDKGFGDSVDRGMKGMLCMLGIGNQKGDFVLPATAGLPRLITSGFL